MRFTVPVGSGPGSAVKKRIASGCANCGWTSSSGSSSPSAIRSCTSTRSTPTAQPDEVGHLPARDPRRALDDDDAPVACRDQLREARSRPEAERVHGVRGDALRLLELLRRDRRRVDVDPADAEADPRRPQAVGERQRDRLAVARDHDPVHLDCRRRTPRGSPRRSARRRAPRADGGRCRRATRRGRRRAGRPSRPA